VQAGTAQARLTAGFRHRLRCLLVSLPREAREVEVERLISEARSRAVRDGVPLPDALLAVHESARPRWPAPPSPLAPPVFLCDPSLEGLARWLRAAGYAAELPVGGVPLHRLPDEALRRGLFLLTTEAETLERRIVADGSLRVLWLPSSLATDEKLGLVLRDLGLALREPRCMACGGELVARPKEDVRPRIPPRTARWKDEYFVCSSCDRLFWQGTHWERIARALSAAGAR
jgi:uncharacterized protein with PIN domain